MVETATVTLPSEVHAYPIRIGAKLLAESGSFIRENHSKASQVFLVADITLPLHYLETVSRSCRQAGLTVHVQNVEASEDHKVMATVEALYSQALACGLKRSDAVIALGGGIIGDMTGFFAATYLRGIPFFQIPTTLLAQVDASIGGKVAVNCNRYKNMIGAFYHPKGVLIDTDTLSTLSEDAFACGMAEVIKYALLETSVPGWQTDTRLWDILNKATCETLPLEQIILRCCQLKAAVVEADPQEKRGIREILNLGHTFGHAYETLSEGGIPHGKAVAIGMMDAFRLAIYLQHISEETLPLLQHLLQKFSLPISSPTAFSADKMIAVMQQDKKAQAADTLRLVLPYDSIGQVRVVDHVSAEAVTKVLGI